MSVSSKHLVSKRKSKSKKIAKKSIPGKKIKNTKSKRDWFVASAADVTSPLDLIRGITNLILDGWEFEVIQFSKKKLTKGKNMELERNEGETDGEFAARQAEAEATPAAPEAAPEAEQGEELPPEAPAATEAE